MKRNIFFPALTELQRQELQTVMRANDCNFHGVLDTWRLVDAPDLDFDELLAEVRDHLKAFDGSVDAIIAHWDFPTSALVPILCKEFGLPSPSLESVLKCEHKYWSRLEQKRAVPEMVPRFCSFDPFSDDPLDHIDLAFPFWIKPVKSFSSQLGFRINDAEDFREAIETVRAEIAHMARPFEQALAHARLPDEIRRANSYTCVAEEIMHGEQYAPEGSVFNGQVHVHGILDMGKDEQERTIDRLYYPTTLPRHMQARMIDACERFLKQIDFDNGCFNAEFMWDRERDKLWLIEVNTRISQSHSELFIDVDGMSNHAVAIDVALGEKPQIPRGKGRHRVAGKFILSKFEDAVVTRVPAQAEIERLQQRFPGLDVLIDVRPGMRLEDLPNQDSYSYHVATLYLGASNRQELLAHYQACVDALKFEYAPIDAAENDFAPPPAGTQGSAQAGSQL